MNGSVIVLGDALFREITHVSYARSDGIIVRILVRVIMTFEIARMRSVLRDACIREGVLLVFWKVYRRI